MSRVRRPLSLILWNVGLFAILWTCAEFALQAAGIEPLGSLARPDARSRRFCDACANGTLKLEQKFVTGPDAIFRAARGSFPEHGGRRAESTSINSSGFRGNEFAPPAEGHTGILLIGDSFTWGASARPLTMSFADRLQRAGYHVYNGGIPGVDVGQYRRVAERYVPAIRPHAVVVCLWEGNDFAAQPMPVEPGRNLHVITNAGYLKGFDDNGRYFDSAEEAIGYWRRVRCGVDRNLLDRIHYRTLLGRIADRLIARPKPAKGEEPHAWIRRDLLAISRVCAANGSDFVILVIPHPKREQKSAFIRERQYVRLFDGMAYEISDAFVAEDYSKPPDNHFNNAGHGKFALFAERTLRERGHLPVPPRDGALTEPVARPRAEAH